MDSHQALESFYLGSEEDWPMAQTTRDIRSFRNHKIHDRSVENRDHSYTSKGTLLILEDFDAIRAYLSEHFRSHGYQVYSASALGDALAVAREEDPEVVAIDYDLGTENAYQAIEHLRSALPGSYIVLMGGPGTHEIEERAKQAGASRVLGKAYHLAELDTIVSEAGTNVYSMVRPS